MKLTTKTTHKLVFRVEYFIATEGGMDSDQFGKDTGNLEQAIHDLELARAQSAHNDWLITIEVLTEVTRLT